MRKLVTIIISTNVLAACIWIYYRNTQRLSAIHAAKTLVTALNAPEIPISPLLVVPASLTDKSPIERESLLRDYLSSELSPEGLAILTRDGDFGPLAEIFPDKAESIAAAAKVALSECLAFKLQRNGLTAQLVLHGRNDGTHQILSANDIKQLAEPPSLP